MFNFNSDLNREEIRRRQRRKSHIAIHRFLRKLPVFIKEWILAIPLFIIIFGVAFDVGYYSKIGIGLTTVPFSIEEYFRTIINSSFGLLMIPFIIRFLNSASYKNPLYYLKKKPTKTKLLFYWMAVIPAGIYLKDLLFIKQSEYPKIFAGLMAITNVLLMIKTWLTPAKISFHDASNTGVI